MRLKLLVLLLLIPVQCVGQRGCRSGQSHLTLHPTDGLGRPLSQAVIKSFVDLRSGKDFAESFGKDRKSPFSASLPFGRYRVEIGTSPGKNAFGRIVDVCYKDESVEVPNRFGRVYVFLFTTNDNGIEDVDNSLVNVADFKNTADGTNMAQLFKSGVATEVPYGSYVLKISDPLGGVIRRRVDVFQADVSVFSGLLAYGEGGAYSGPLNIVQGQITNIPMNEKPIFVTMSGIYIPYMINSTVSPDGDNQGTFTFEGVIPSGVYMLFTVGKLGVLDARQLTVPVKGEVVVELSHPHPPEVRTN